MKRRDFLKIGSVGVAGAMATAATGLIAWTPRVHAATIRKTLYITDGYLTMIDGTNVYLRGFSSSSSGLNVPGEHMIVQEGDTVEITIENTLDTDHSFYIKGISGADTGTVRGGRSKTISFKADKWGSYLYHDRLNAPYNRLVGLHGGFAVMPKGNSTELKPGSPTYLYPGSKTFVQQYFWIFSEFDPVWHDRVRRGRTPSTAYKPRYFTLNGLGGRPPDAPGNGDPTVDNMHDPRSALHGHVGDRALVRILNAGLCQASVHAHANHVEWLTENGKVRDEVWQKDCVYLEGDMGAADCIYPFQIPPDAYPQSLAQKGEYPMHLHTEMSQTAAGGYYMFGSMTDIYFE